MSVSKRLRYEILRRDGHKCRYCGATAADAPLTVDHVIPVALGGTDEPDNLVAACRPCNAGKSSAKADEALVGDVSADAIRWANAIKQAGQEIAAESAKTQDVLDAVQEFWRPRYLPSGWQTSVTAILRAGLSPGVIYDLVDVAKTMPGVDDRFRYFCGCCWKRVREMQERAQTIVTTTSASDANEWTADNITSMWLRCADEWRNRMRFDLPECVCGPAAGFCGDSECKLILVGVTIGIAKEPNEIRTMLGMEASQSYAS